MGPAALLSAGPVQSLCPFCSASRKWQSKRLVPTVSAVTRASSAHRNLDKASVKSSISLRRLDSAFGSGRRSGLGPETRSCPSRHVFTAAVEGSIAVDETESSISGSPEENAESVSAAADPPSPAKTDRPIPKFRREDATVPTEALVEGAVFTGKVTTIQPFGAFVDFGAFTDGLVHISKLSTRYVSNVRDVVQLGQEVKVTILSVDNITGRIALTMLEKEDVAAAKTGNADARGDRFKPGPDGRPVNRGRIAGGGRQIKRDDQKPPTKLTKGQEVEGTVKNKSRSGVFIELADDEEGFVRHSDIPGGENMAPEASLQAGQKIKATVLRIDRGKILLTMKPVVDIVSVNRDINKGKDSYATNPFEIAFRAFNLIPAVPVSPIEEEIAPPEAASVVKEVNSEAAPAVKQPISEAAAATEEEAVAEAAAAAIESPATEEIVPEALAPIVDEEAFADVPSVDSAVSAAIDAAAQEQLTLIQDEALAGAPSPVDDALNEAIAGVAEEQLNSIVPDVVGEDISPVREETISPSEIDGATETSAAVGEDEAGTEEQVLAESTAADKVSPAAEEIVPEALIVEDEAFADVPSLGNAVNGAIDAAVQEQLTSIQEEALAGASFPVDDAVNETIAAIAEEQLNSIAPDVLGEDFAPVPEETLSPSEVDGASETTATVGEDEVLSVEGGPRASEGSPADGDVSAGHLPEVAALVADSPAEEQPMPEAVASVAEEEVVSDAIPGVATLIEDSPAVAVEDGSPDEEQFVPDATAPVAKEEEVSPEAVASSTVEEPVVEKAQVGISAAIVKQLRDETGAGMMDCKRALAETGGDIEQARETLRKKGLASADKKASRIASEGLIGSYVHDSRIGVLLEVNCETDFVSRGPAFKSLVEDLGMQVVASQQVQYVSVDDVPAEVVNKEKELEAQREDLAKKPAAIREKIVEGRVSKRLNEFALLEQPYIRDDKIFVKDFVKQTIASLGENIKVRRFERYVLGEGLQKKGTDFAAEVAAQTAVKAPEEAPKKAEEAPPAAPVENEHKVVVSANLVKELRDQTGAGMMDCKKALASTDNDLEKAVEFLRKKGLASADKKASRLASEGLIGSYIHDGRIGILIEVNSETDFVARGEKFKELVDDLAMQIAAYPQVQVVSVDDVPADVVAKEKKLESGKEDLAGKPEAIRARIVDGRVAKRLAELALLEQPFIKDDKKLVKDVVKEAIASLGENIQVRRFTRFNLGEGIEKKVVDFASEVAAQSGKTT